MVQTNDLVGRSTRTLCLGSILFILAAAGCVCDVPDQSQFKPLEELEFQDDAVVRIYGAPLPILECLAYHSWIVLKHPGLAIFDRWEVGIDKTGPWDHLWKNVYDAHDPTANPGGFALTETIGPEAEPIIEFIETQSPNYPLQHIFILYPGPNCNTYTAWVVEKSGWDYELPQQNIGKDYPVPWPPTSQPAGSGG